MQHKKKRTHNKADIAQRGEETIKSPLRDGKVPVGKRSKLCKMYLCTDVMAMHNNSMNESNPCLAAPEFLMTQLGFMCSKIK